jgi:hypothetical protein
VDHLQAVGGIVGGLRDLGLNPVLVGGIALVVLGSRRVTREFDFVVAHPGDRLARTLAVFYDRGLELASRVNDVGEVIATIASRRVAAIRLRLDAHVFHVASEADLLRLKNIARAKRSAPGDAEDIAFLEARRTPTDNRGRRICAGRRV